MEALQQHDFERPRIGLALGAGSARGWAHVGVIKALAEMDIHPDIITGTSVGAIVGAVHAIGALEGFENWLLKLGRRDVLGYMDLRFAGGGFFEGRRLVATFREHFGDVRFEDLRLPFGAIATELETGLEVWLREGSVAEAVRASISLPGIFTPVEQQGRWLVDGGLVNPVPVSLCRAMGADRVIAVSLNGDILGRHNRRKPIKQPVDDGDTRQADPNWMDRLASGLRQRPSWLRIPQLGTPGMPGLMQVTATSVNIMQDRITRSRMAGDPPDILISPRLAHIGLLEFDRAQDVIPEGEAATRRMAPAIRDLLGDD